MEAGRYEHLEPVRPDPGLSRFVRPKESGTVSGGHEAAFERPAARGAPVLQRDRSVPLRLASTIFLLRRWRPRFGDTKSAVL